MTILEKILIICLSLYAAAVFIMWVAYKYVIRCQILANFILQLTINYNNWVQSKDDEITILQVPTPRHILYSLKRKVPENFLSRDILECLAACPANQQYLIQ